MTDAQLRTRIATRAVAGQYTLFLGLGGALAVAGLGLFFANAFGADAARSWHLFHVNWLFFTGLAGGSLALSAVHKIAKAKWSGVIIRFAEAASAFLPFSLLGLILIFTLGYDHIYGPMMKEIDAHTIFHGKAVWLSRPWMFTRLFLSLGLMTWLGYKMIWHGMKPDFADAAVHVTGEKKRRYEKWSAGYDAAATDERIFRLAPMYAATYAMAFTFVAFDGIMALQPHWFSNLLGGFYFMGSFLGGHTLLALMMMYGARHLGVNDLVSAKQRHDLGKLCFGFTVFWAYLMWAQFLVIWYGNLPEEAGFVFARLWGHWLPIGRAVLLGMFVIPFIGLLGVAPKKFPITLGIFTTISLCSLWLERYLLVVPSVTTADGPVVGLPEIAPTLGLLGLFLVAYALFARNFPMVSPRLALVTLERERGHGHGHEFEHEDPSQDYALPKELDRRGKPRA
jgi:Ni/Fe-hydrogenase subunit HybB-like protein